MSIENTLEVDWKPKASLNLITIAVMLATFVEVLNTSTGVTNIVYLAKTDTHAVIRDLTPNVFYNLTFKYTYNDDKGNLKEFKFEDNL